MILSKDMHPKKYENKSLITVTLNVHVIKRRIGMRKFITLEAQFIKVGNRRSKLKL